jgi:hypothetical protein
MSKFKITRMNDIYKSAKLTPSVLDVLNKLKFNRKNNSINEVIEDILFEAEIDEELLKTLLYKTDFLNIGDNLFAEVVYKKKEQHKFRIHKIITQFKQYNPSEYAKKNKDFNLEELKKRIREFYVQDKDLHSNIETND